MSFEGLGVLGEGRSKSPPPSAFFVLLSWHQESNEKKNMGDKSPIYHFVSAKKELKKKKALIYAL